MPIAQQQVELVLVIATLAAVGLADHVLVAVAGEVADIDGPRFWQEHGWRAAEVALAVTSQDLDRIRQAPLESLCRGDGFGRYQQVRVTVAVEVGAVGDVPHLPDHREPPRRSEAPRPVPEHHTDGVVFGVGDHQVRNAVAGQISDVEQPASSGQRGLSGVFDEREARGGADRTRPRGELQQRQRDQCHKPDAHPPRPPEPSTHNLDSITSERLRERRPAA